MRRQSHPSLLKPGIGLRKLLRPWKKRLRSGGVAGGLILEDGCFESTYSDGRSPRQNFLEVLVVDSIGQRNRIVQKHELFSLLGLDVLVGKGASGRV